MPQDFIERREDGFYLTGSRVPIDRVAVEYLNGEEPEAIQLHYPTLNLEQVNDAIAFYLDHKAEVENIMAEHDRAGEEFRRTHPTPPHLKEKLARARQEMLVRRSG